MKLLIFNTFSDHFKGSEFFSLSNYLPKNKIIRFLLSDLIYSCHYYIGLLSKNTKYIICRYKITYKNNVIAKNDEY